MLARETYFVLRDASTHVRSGVIYSSSSGAVARVGAAGGTAGAAGAAGEAERRHDR